jgi:hypothetical protein
LPPWQRLAAKPPGDVRSCSYYLPVAQRRL